MSFNVLPRMAWSTIMAFRHGRAGQVFTSCSLCGGVQHWGSDGPAVHRGLATTSSRLVRGKNNSFRYRRRGTTTTAVLEHFIKQTNMDGTLVAKAPFNLSCSGSYFNSGNNVDTARNKEVELSRDQFYKDEKIRRREENNAKVEEDILNREQRSDKTPGMFLQMGDGLPKNISEREITEVERRILDQLSKQNQEDMLHSINYRTRSPLHVKLLGKTHLRVDSYSIMRNRAHSSHIYISDVGTVEEAARLISENGDNTEGKFSPSGSVSIWRPKQVSEVEITENVPGWNSEEEVVSALKIYAPSHITEDSDSGLKIMFLCPTLMNKIYLEAENHASIDLNCKLMDQLVSVGLCTEYGPIRIRDVWAHDITLATRFGDIMCEGTVEGNITAEIFGDGDFVSRITVGSKLKVATDSGDISLWSDCFAELAELYTQTGHIHVRYLYGSGKILVKEHGSISVNLVEGNLAAVVKSGSMFINVEKLTEDSFLEVETGDITLTVPHNFPFRITVTGTSTDISPEILNAGEFFLSGGGVESFVSGVITGPGEFQPTVSVKCHHGRVSLQTQKGLSGRKIRGPSEL